MSIIYQAWLIILYNASKHYFNVNQSKNTKFILELSTFGSGGHDFPVIEISGLNQKMLQNNVMHFIPAT